MGVLNCAKIAWNALIASVDIKNSVHLSCPDLSVAKMVNGITLDGHNLSSDEISVEPDRSLLSVRSSLIQPWKGSPLSTQKNLYQKSKLQLRHDLKAIYI